MATLNTVKKDVERILGHELTKSEYIKYRELRWGGITDPEFIADVIKQYFPIDLRDGEARQ